MPSTQAVPQEDRLSAQDLREAWLALCLDERVEGFLLLPRGEAEDLFFSLSPAEQAALVIALPED